MLELPPIPRLRPEDRAARRSGLLDLFESHVYGRTPAGGHLDRVAVRTDEPVDGGRRVELDVTVAGPRGERTVPVLVHVPEGAPVAVVVALNFAGNHATTPAPGVRIGRNRDVARGSRASRWPYRAILGRGYAVATAHYEDFEIDSPGHAVEGVRGLFSHDPRDPHGWGAIGAWAWGLSRVFEAMAGVPGFEPGAAVALGHSRLGKAALWAGAQDGRFAAVVANDSGCGGAGLHRHRAPGKETIAAITARFPHWFAPTFAGYADREADLPVDAHELLALIAPRAVHVASAVEDLWADPLGEYLATVAASPAYEAFGLTGTRSVDEGSAVLPTLGQRVGGRLSYHARPGGHDLTAQDWELALDAADDAFTAEAAPS
ncbi:acetylxylan esterase [Occultella glacieicola]|uniref:Acetylxylan esterase n=1 Tax=Occultella glacieicola TaxID=2518684 RepID=A0ABY2E899_9MICO|nr:acetylxylan esterase [Occultella glacieicola]TDE97208.1 acetylxylan esterase [Occultella glacieicola]